MSSRLRILIRQMESALRESGLQRELARARPLEPFLKDFADADAILDAFADQRAETYPVREALTRAVIGARAEVEDQAILRSAARRLAVLLDGELRNDDFEIVVSTTLYGKTIKAAVEDLVGHTLDTPGTVYQRYKKRHHKALRRAQKRMAEVDLEHDELGPLFAAAGLLPPEQAEAGAMA